MHEHGVRTKDKNSMTEKRIILKIKKALREHGSIGVLRQMHFGVAFYVIPAEDVYAWHRGCRLKRGAIISTIYEEWYDRVPSDEKAIEVYRQGDYRLIPWGLVLRRLKERRLAA